MNKHSNRLRRLLSVRPLARAIIMVAAIAVVATGITYAFLQSQNATLADNSFATATADLRISKTNTTFTPREEGFNFTNIIPGVEPSDADAKTIFLKNYGTSTLKLMIYSGSTPDNSGNLPLDKIYLSLTRTDAGGDGQPQKISLALLLSSGPDGVPLEGTLAIGATARYKLHITADEDAQISQTGGMAGIDFVFNGSATSAVVPQ